MKNFNDTIGNRTLNLPTCGAMPQPSAPPRAQTQPIYIYIYIYTITGKFYKELKVSNCPKTQNFNRVVKQQEYQIQIFEPHGRKTVFLKIPICLNVGELLFTMKTLHLFLF
jgi:hypothetical protein